MSTRVSSFIGMVVIAGFLGGAWATGEKGGMLAAIVGLFVLAPAFALLLGSFLRGDR